MNTIEKVQKQITHMISDYSYLLSCGHGDTLNMRYSVIIATLENHKWMIEECTNHLLHSDVLLGSVDDERKSFQRMLVMVIDTYRPFTIHMNSKGEIE